MRTAKRWALVLILAAAYLLPSGCSRTHYRLSADRNVDDILTEKNIYPPWLLEDWNVYPNSKSRFWDPTNPDRPPKPCDDPATKYLSPNPQPAKHVGEGGWEGTGWLDLIRNWDEINRQDPETNLAVKPMASALPPPTRSSDAALDALHTNEHPFIITLDQCCELGLINSREFQDRREDVYLAALPVTLQRYNFAAQFFATEEVLREWAGRDLPDAGNRWSGTSDIAMRRFFPTGALLLVRFANTVVVNMTNNGPRVLTPSLLSLDLAQPFLRGGGFAVNLEPLTQVERDLVYQIRAYARFRKQFYTAVAAGSATASGSQTTTGAALFSTFGGFTVTPLPPTGTNLITGYLPTLLRVAFLMNQKNNVDELERILTFYRQLQGGGDVSPLQTDQVVSQLLNSQSTLLTRQQDVRDSLDRFKQLLGVPTSLPLELDDGPVRPLNRHLERLRAVFNEDRALSLEQRPLGNANIDQLREEFRRRFLELPLVRGTPFQERIGERLDRWQRLPAASLDQEIRRLHDERVQMSNRQLQVQSEGKQLSPEEQAKLDELSLEVNLGLFEQALRSYLSRSWEQAFGELPEPERTNRRNRMRSDMFRSVFDAFIRILGTARDQRLDLVRKSWPGLPSACVAGVNLLTADLDQAIAAASQAALTNRLDLMNARAQVVDAWRQVAVRANALLGVANARYHLDVNTLPLTNQPFDLRASASRSQLFMNFELPLTRMLERNDYRTALIAFQRSRRTLQAAEDQVLLEARSQVRELRVLAENYKIQQRAVPVAYSQRDNSLEQLRIPNPPGSATSAGNAAALTQQLLSSQSIVLNNENALYQFYVGFLTARTQLFRDLELMPLDPRGVWNDEHTIRDCVGPCELPGSLQEPTVGPELQRREPERIPEPKPGAGPSPGSAP